MDPETLRTARTKTLTTRRTAADRFVFDSHLEDVCSTRSGEEWQELIHHISIRGSIRIPDLVLEDVEPVVDVMPYGLCRRTAGLVASLSGLRIGPGYRRAVLDLMGGTAGCTHFLTLALELAQLHTLTVYQRMRELVPAAKRTDAEWMQAGLAIEDRLVNACATLVADSPVIVEARTLGPLPRRP